MTFNNPSILYALVALVIPVIIHLLNFRRYRKVYFSNVSFLKVLQMETKRRSRLLHILVMLCRMMAIAALVLAFADPVFSGKKDQETGGRYVSVYIDNSFSMEAEGEEGSLLEESRAAAISLVEGFGMTDHFQIITNDLDPVHYHFLPRDEVVAYIAGIEYTPVSISMQQIMRRMRQVGYQSNVTNHLACFISDFQISTVENKIWPQDTIMEQWLIPLQANPLGNIYVDSCWFNTPVQQAGHLLSMSVRIVNGSPVPQHDVSVTLSVDGRQRSMAAVNIDGGMKETVTLSFTLDKAGDYCGVISLKDYPVTYDDDFYFSFHLRKEIPVLVVGDSEHAFLPKLFATDSVMQYAFKNYLSLEYSALERYHVVILDRIPEISSGLAGALSDYVNQGGTVVVAPGIESDYALLYNKLRINVPAFLDTVKVGSGFIDLEHPLFNDVFDYIPENMNLPVVNRYFHLKTDARYGGASLIRLRNGENLLMGYARGAGRVYQLTVPLDKKSSNLLSHPVFVPMMLRMALLSQSTESLYYIVGDMHDVLLKQFVENQEAVIKLFNPVLKKEWVMSTQRRGQKTIASIPQSVQNAGIYHVMVQDTVAGFWACNYNRQESDLRCFSVEQLKDVIGDNEKITVVDKKKKSVVQWVKEASAIKSLSGWLVMICLLALAMEIMFLRLAAIKKVV